MTDPWKGFGWQPGVIPQAPLDNELRAQLHLPATLRPVQDPGVVQPAIFEPALKQHANAYRAADPRFADERIGRAWYAARRSAMDLVLAAIANSPWADALVLRGSVLLRAWFGDAAREPGDLDFVVVPASWRIEEQRTDDMLTGIAQAAESAGWSSGPGVQFDAAEAVSEDIWTYERVPGRRLILPWTAADLPGGIVQLDFVFNERLPVAPEPLLVPAAHGDSAALLNAATAELSLAWKLMWLLTDTYPQGKDLYDAVLLAEHTLLRFEVLREAFLDAVPDQGTLPVDHQRISALPADAEWKHFSKEYPDLTGTGTAADFVDRLSTALEPTFRDIGTPGESGYARHVRWLAPRIVSYRPLLHDTSMRALQTTMRADCLPILAAIVITRELLGAHDHTIEDARVIVFADPAWARHVALYQRVSSWLDQDLDRL
ncbi:nucleotidyl transferase AbiEii/AbiGii toxin family protein [Streptacidiphilus sp. PAMC 29251]